MKVKYTQIIRFMENIPMLSVSPRVSYIMLTTAESEKLRIGDIPNKGYTFWQFLCNFGVKCNLVLQPIKSIECMELCRWVTFFCFFWTRFTSASFLRIGLNFFMDTKKEFLGRMCFDDFFLFFVTHMHNPMAVKDLSGCKMRLQNVTRLHFFCNREIES